MDYRDEPEVVFSPLSPEDYCDFYSLEMNDFQDDAHYYLLSLSSKDTVIELGCGTGRLSRLLSKECQHVIGIDISEEMLKKALTHVTEKIDYLNMDMTDFHLPCNGDAIIIPYNSLNLLGSLEKIEQCFHLCREHLSKTGKLLLQVYQPSKQLCGAAKEKIFQFVMLKRQNGDTVIKETLKSYTPENNMLELIERYRDRPFVSKGKNRDLEHCLYLFTPPAQSYKEILHTIGFNSVNFYGGYDRTPFDQSIHTTLLIEASLS